MLHRRANLPADTLITDTIVISRTVRYDADGHPRYRVHLTHPHGPMDPHLEQGILEAALRQSHERTS
ncbi:hypothetical protein [Saccharothrix violaceirubra]